MKIIINIIILIFMVPYILAGTQSDSLMVNKTDIVKIYNDVRELEHSDSLKTEQIIILKDLINKKDFLISQLEENSRIDSMYIEIYKEQANLNEPTIGEKKELGFLYGVCLIVSSSGIIYNIK